jgi:putative glycosyltransferase (TIGR04372 family)
MRDFLNRQLQHIQAEGFAAIRRKAVGLGKPLVYWLLVLAALPVVVAVRLARPVVRIRFGSIRSDVIGHFVFDPEYYLSWREDAGFNFVDFFFFHAPSPPNKHWIIMVARTLKVHPSVRYLDRANQLLPGAELHRARTLPAGQRSIDPQGVTNRTDPHIHFTEDEQIRGRETLASMGMEEGARFMCLIVRDSAYKASKESIKQDWSRHDYRDTDIDDYSLASKELAERGSWVLRMGKVVEKPLALDHSRVIDYANSPFRSDFLDIWLTAHCHFATTSGTGLDDVTVAYRRPYAQVNQLPVGGIRSYKFGVVLFKYLRSQETGELLGLREQISNGIVYSLFMQEYRELGLEIVNNTPEEICDTVGEVEARLDGTWEKSEEDEELQKRFWEMLREWDGYDKHHGEVRARVCTSFLRRNHEWFLR